MEFVGAGVEEDDGESREKTVFHVGGSVRKAESKPDGAVKYKIFGHMGGFPDGEAHEFDEFGILCRIPVEKTELCADHKDQTLTVSLISVDSAAGWAENQKMVTATQSAGSQESSFTAAG